MSEPPPSDRTKVRRLPQRGDYDPQTVRAIVDAALICHVGLVSDGSPVVIPMLHARVDEAEKDTALRAFVEHVAPGRWEEIRRPSDAERRATAVVALPMDEASAKVRTGPPVDDPADLAGPWWAGEVPLVTTAGPARPAPDLAPDVTVPPSVVACVAS